MTIKIEREAVLTAIGASHPALPPSSYRSTSTMPAHHGVAYSPVKPHELIESSMAPSWYAETISHITRGNMCLMAEDDSIPELDDTDDECSTISSFSSVVRSRSPARATVTFASTLVTEVRTRPRTRPEDVSALFYSCEETQRFRQQYRQERRGTQEDDTTTSPSVASTAETVTLFDDDCMTNKQDETVSTGGHRISRVVVMHEDTLETFIDKDLAAIQPPFSLGGGDVTTADNVFFDNDRFWSGQITWY